MNIVVAILAASFAHCAIGHMPNVNEFCSHIVANNAADINVCQANNCQGRPGKLGPPGMRGLVGDKGQKGEEGSCESMAAKIRQLEESIEEHKLYFATLPKDVHCYMGMKSGYIPDSAITSSSDYNSNHAAKLGRLDNKPSGGYIGSWVAGKRSPDEWIQVDFGEPKLVAGVVTQGRPNTSYHQWVKTFKLQCGNSVATLKFITENGAVKIFNGNRDGNTKVVNLLPSPMECRYIRLYTLSWQSFNSMRLEFIHGMCYNLF